VNVASPDILTSDARPKSPWTPSYSVTVTGSPFRETAQLDPLEATPAGDLQHITKPSVANLQPVESEDFQNPKGVSAEAQPTALTDVGEAQIPSKENVAIREVHSLLSFEIM